MLDFDLAELYQVETKSLKRSVRRNIERFPDDFMFQLPEVEFMILAEEFESIPALFDPKHGGTRHLPFVFTELGVAMLSSVLNSSVAIEVNIQIMRTFVQLRSGLGVVPVSLDQVNALTTRLETLEAKVTRISIPRISNRANRRFPDAVVGAKAGKELSAKVDMIKDLVARKFEIQTADLVAVSRKKEILLPRQIAIYLVRKYFGLGFDQLGHFFKRDRTTVMSAYSKISSQMQAGGWICEIVSQIQSDIDSKRT